MFLIHDLFNDKLPTTFNGFYSLQQNPEKDPTLDLRVVKPPSQFD